MPEVTIRRAQLADVVALPVMQVAADILFRDLGMDAVADGPAPSIDGFRSAAGTGDLTVADLDDEVRGFVRTRPLDDSLHVEPLTVAPTAQRQGVGNALMRAVEVIAKDRGFARLTLTPFRDVAFNGPFYRRIGWVEIAPEELTPGLRAERQEEASTGLDRWPRLAMAKTLSGRRSAPATDTSAFTR